MATTAPIPPWPQAGRDYPNNWLEFQDWFRTDDDCLAYLERLRWGSGFQCPKCGCFDGRYRRERAGVRRCLECWNRVSVASGTVFHRSHLPMRIWFGACWQLATEKGGVSAQGLQRALGIGAYSTAWLMLHKLRRAMIATSGELSGEVEVDETYFGGRKAGTGGRGAAGKAIVAIAVEHRKTGLGRIRMEVVEDASAKSLTRFVLENTADGSKILTDAWRGYARLDQYREHEMVSVSGSGGPAHASLPGVHRVAALLKRWVLGTHQGGISMEQLDWYLAQFVFRFNRRKSSSRGLLFLRLLECAVATPPQPQATITAHHGFNSARSATGMAP